MVPRDKSLIDSPIRELPPPSELVFRLGGLHPLKKSGDQVTYGEILAASGEQPHPERCLASPMEGEIAELNGEILRIRGTLPIPPRFRACPPLLLDKMSLLEKIRRAGLVGMGGGMFPTHRKLNPGRPIHTLMVNASESEPLVVCDSRILAEYPREVKCGMEIAGRILGATRTLIANDPEGYPYGYERLLVERHLGIKMEPGKRVMDYGVMVFNVQTIWQIHKTICWGIPLTERVITIAGDGFRHPGNYRVPLGTSVSHLIRVCEYQENPHFQLLAGGPMMGRRVTPLDSVDAGTIALLSLPRHPLNNSADHETPCIRCGSCIENCPQSIPVTLELADPTGRFKECISCGMCQYVCPAGRPLLPLIRKSLPGGGR